MSFFGIVVKSYPRCRDILRRTNSVLHPMIVVYGNLTEMLPVAVIIEIDINQIDEVTTGP